MTAAVVVVGPTTVRGPGTVDSELISVALECIDDELALVDDDVVPTDRLWRNVLEAAVGGSCDAVVLVCPSWWSDPRVARVEAAARTWAADVTVLRRLDVLASAATVVEIASDIVVIRRDSHLHAIARTGLSERVVGAVVASLNGVDTATVDAPAGATLFGAELAQALRLRGVAVTVVGDHDVSRRARPTRVDVVPRRGLVTARTVVLAGAALSVVVLLTAAWRVDTEAHDDEAADPVGVTWLVEGRVAVEVPADWTVERITSGPGSARVQVISPSDGSAAIHVVQSRTANRSLAATADELELALAGEAEGVFVDFDANARRAGRPVVAYREVRDARHVSWAVQLDRGVRIAIGCQGSVDSPAPQQDCDRAIESAHAVA